MFWFDHGMNGWGWGLVPGLLWLGFWALTVTAVVLVVRGLARSPADRPAGPPDPYTGSPERLLAERYARGEIDDDEYGRRLGMLRSVR